MNFFKIKKFRKAQKPGIENEEDKPVPQPEEPKNGNDCNYQFKSANADPAAEAEDDDDDFITNEVKRRLKELRRNSFMVLIPEEEPCTEEEQEEEEEEEGETSSSEWRDVEAEGQQWWRGFDAVFDKYCEGMLFFDRMSLHQLSELGKGFQQPSAAREPDDESEHLQQPENEPYQDIETAYAGQICLTWEALHCLYTQMSRKISCQHESSSCYNQSAQQFQQFQVLLQRFIENEPFEQGLRAEIYARTRNLLPKLIQVPNIQGSDQQGTEDDSDTRVLAPDLIRIIENAILTFHRFLKIDKKKSSGVRNMFGNQNQLVTPLQQIQSSIEKKAMKLKELRTKRKGWKKKSWPQTHEDVQLLLGLIDIKVISRVLRMMRITTTVILV
ncbi:Ribosomal protein L34Ae [Quillaja saponaria]|uniref:Ribosomal protein L34Ae n=1 Tax=Quillaja saponaria TaxID=32244 RepID=A0AAD7LR37_QUISA|nr:Ribosomal protein L34Ae [Quillaja saponaria]